MNKTLEILLDECNLPGLTKAWQEWSTAQAHTEINIKLAVLNNHTINNLSLFFKCAAALNQIKTEVLIEDFDVFMPALLNSQSALRNFNPDILLISWLWEYIAERQGQSEVNVRDIEQQVSAVIEAALSNTQATIVITSFALALEDSDGFLSPQRPQGSTSAVKALNDCLWNWASREPRLKILNIDRLYARFGIDRACDWRMWYLAKSLWTPLMLKSIAQEIVGLAEGRIGKTKKCLLLDCDGTLWSGIIGEDGLNGIGLSRNDYPGRIFFDIHREILKLNQRGILIALCSKNNPEDIWRVIDSHPDCLIKREHLAACRLNWQDKASNIKELAKELNLGLDSFVFIDDSETEVAWIETALPMVKVVKVPEKLWQYPSLLRNLSCFEPLSLSAEDTKRNQMYRFETQRNILKEQYSNYDDFLITLKLEVTLDRACNNDFSRIAQLTQKTNQFNLTTRRYNEAQIDQFNRKGDLVVSVSVKDRFGDYGLVGVGIVLMNSDNACIDTFLMSCRILGRGVETVILSSILQYLKEQSYSRVWGEYIQTPKNQQVADFYIKNKFTRTGGIFELDLKQWVPIVPKYLTVLDRLNMATS